MEKLSSSRKRLHGTSCSDGVDDDDVFPLQCSKKPKSSVYEAEYDPCDGDEMKEKKGLEVEAAQRYVGLSRRVSEVSDWPPGFEPSAVQVVARDEEEEYESDNSIDDLEPDLPGFDDSYDEQEEGFQSESSVCGTPEELVLISGTEDGKESEDCVWDAWLGPESDYSDDDDEASTACGPTTAVQVVTCSDDDDNGHVDKVKSWRDWYPYIDEVDEGINWYDDDYEFCVMLSEESTASNKVGDMEECSSSKRVNETEADDAEEDDEEEYKRWLYTYSDLDLLDLDQPRWLSD